MKPNKLWTTSAFLMVGLAAIGCEPPLNPTTPPMKPKVESKPTDSGAAAPSSAKEPEVTPDKPAEPSDKPDSSSKDKDKKPDETKSNDPEKTDASL